MKITKEKHYNLKMKKRFLKLRIKMDQRTLKLISKIIETEKISLIDQARLDRLPNWMEL